MGQCQHVEKVQPLTFEAPCWLGWRVNGVRRPRESHTLPISVRKSRGSWPVGRRHGSSVLHVIFCRISVSRPEVFLSMVEMVDQSRPLASEIYSGYAYLFRFCQIPKSREVSPITMRWATTQAAHAPSSWKRQRRLDGFGSWMVIDHWKVSNVPSLDPQQNLCSDRPWVVF